MLVRRSRQVTKPVPQTPYSGHCHQVAPNPHTVLEGSFNSLHSQLPPNPKTSTLLSATASMITPSGAHALALAHLCAHQHTTAHSACTRLVCASRGVCRTQAPVFCRGCVQRAKAETYEGQTEQVGASRMLRSPQAHAVRHCSLGDSAKRTACVCWHEARTEGKQKRTAWHDMCSQPTDSCYEEKQGKHTIQAEYVTSKHTHTLSGVRCTHRQCLHKTVTLRGQFWCAHQNLWQAMPCTQCAGWVAASAGVLQLQCQRCKDPKPPTSCAQSPADKRPPPEKLRNANSRIYTHTRPAQPNSC